MNVVDNQATYIDSFIDEGLAQQMLDTLIQDLAWQQPSIWIAGKNRPIPRLQSWQASSPIDYTYSGKTFSAEPFHPLVESLRLRIEEITQKHFNSVLCNLYRNGSDSVSWHADDEPELGENPVIASYSIGAERHFNIRPKTTSTEGDRKLAHKILLKHNSLLIMKSGFQSTWEHQLPKTQRKVGPRINLTFRLTHCI